MKAAKQLLKPSGNWALFLDFDGTLVDIASRPDDITIDPQLHSTLVGLKNRFQRAVAIISGRSIDALDYYINPCPVDAVGLHGHELRVSGKIIKQLQKDPQLAQVLKDLKSAAKAFPGTLIEDKTYSIGLHWRTAPHYAEQMLNLAEIAQKNLGRYYRLQPGKRMIEILPAQADKATAIKQLLQTPFYKDRHPIFVGDDLTDESGFKTVNEKGGVSILVGTRDTAAHYRISSPTNLRSTLAEWAKTSFSENRLLKYIATQ
jgi:trehalose 6-phosphate phosphatase